MACRFRYVARIDVRISDPVTLTLFSDTDEYLVPMGNYSSLKDFLRDAHNNGTEIVSFRSSRGRLRMDHSYPIGGAREKLDNATFLEAYNCDSAGSPKPGWADRARKQVYTSDYVKYHYVHYSTVTQGTLQTFNETAGEWNFKMQGDDPPVQRNTDELQEAVMLHTKSLHKDQTHSYEQRCRFDFEKKWQGCWVAYPWPDGKKQKVVEDANGMEYNCFINPVVENYWGPRLREAMQSAHLVLSN